MRLEYRIEWDEWMAAETLRRIGTAGWNIPRAHRERFPINGTQLSRYAARLNAVEINTSFYRPHAVSTYQRWAALVPIDFRFAVKVPRLITHERALAGSRDALRRFLDESAGLGAKRGPLLVQLPPSHVFNARRIGRFLDLLRASYDGPVVCEPRHATWSSPPAAALLARFNIARVAADPARAVGLDEPGGWPGFVYYRLHGSPRPYFSPYAADRLADLVSRLSACAVPAWCIFDNTGSGAAAGNALDLADGLTGR
jgi:uncharacterized protein YecE (DUF72 family)